MKKRKAMQLVEALRSGKYNQGKNLLVDDNDNFCCLGVACNISRADLTWEFYKDRWFMDNRYGSLPPRIKKEFGFYEHDPKAYWVKHEEYNRHRHNRQLRFMKKIRPECAELIEDLMGQKSGFSPIKLRAGFDDVGKIIDELGMVFKGYSLEELGLNEVEHGFIGQMIDWKREDISDKQAVWLIRLRDKLAQKIPEAFE